MPREIELKLRVESHDPVRERLRAAGGEFVSAGLETNVIFDRPDGSLRARGMGLRVRSFVDPGGRHTRVTVTVKGPRCGGAIKSRDEVEFGADDAETAVAALEMLGYRRILRYEKRRETWAYEGCHVELDEPARLGVLFVEIEGPGEAVIATVRTKLGLSAAADVAASYVRLMTAYCRDYGVDSHDVRFLT
ncbi:MAG: class IV adenylate cyclase [Phycisphaerae bacterium]